MEEKRHYSVIDQFDRKLTIKYKDQVIAESTNTLILKEVGKGVYNPVYYFPKTDIKFELISDDERNSFCPIKGTASYWQLAEKNTENYFAWSYEDPLPKSKKIEGYVAFNMDYITMISEPLAN